MFKKLSNIIYLLFFLISIFFVLKFYFSDKNILETNRSRSSYSLAADQNNLPLLENDTSNIITYKKDLEEFNKKKKRLWEKLITN